MLEEPGDQGVVDWDVPLDAGFQTQFEGAEHPSYECDAHLREAV